MVNKNTILTILLISISIVNTQSFSSFNSKLTKEQKKMITQAKSLESAGLLDEAAIIYNNILQKFPILREAFIPLKKIYLNKNDLSNLKEIANTFLLENNYSIESKLDVLDIYILLNDTNWLKIAKEIYSKRPPNKAMQKKVLAILTSNNKDTLAIDLINQTRKNNKTKSFYSLEMGMKFSVKLNFKESIKEYLLYLEDNPRNIRLISQRIMMLTDNPSSINIIRNGLAESNISESKIILSKLEFKLKNYEQSYSILKQLLTSDKYILELIDDLIKIKKYSLAYMILDDLLSTSNNKKVLHQAISKLASLYEIDTIDDSNIFPISQYIFKNQILESPFVEIDINKSGLLLKAINIYDSLSVYGKDVNSKLHLANIKYRIYKDLDGAEKIYYQILDSGLSLNDKQNVLADIININLSKGDINKTITLIDSLYNNTINSELFSTLDLKKIQTYYYSLNRDSLILNTTKFLKSVSKDNKLYNDLLDIKSLFTIYKDEEIQKYIKAKFKIIQNKRNEAINILDSISIENSIFGLSVYESAYLETLEKNYMKALEKILRIESIDTIYKQRSLILKAEIYDYGLNNKSKAVDIYLNFIDLFPNSIFYDLIRLRLRELAL